ncbi:hypothetical protein [Deinococcus arenicola]|uniref:Uncharacterized protein n=1 Tax=Deinococcus arenicola TaxID=2994950 RepID=A0ABU4DWN7_9DEIO|nr:hypothetical protein [Deinococcus sp. ZS9-10]MDV6376357.1 hypothetical protein [Deinococcus sp. ZS9-10]
MFPTPARLLVLAALTLLPSSAAPAPDCNLRVAATVTITPGIYRVRLSLPASCPRAAQVRLESYVGGTYPRTGWATLRPGDTWERLGVPWYWRTARLQPDHTITRAALPGARRP